MVLEPTHIQASSPELIVLGSLQRETKQRPMEMIREPLLPSPALVESPQPSTSYESEAPSEMVPVQISTHHSCTGDPS